MHTSALKPTIGRVIWFYPDAGFSNTNTPSGNGDPLPALICRVWSDTCINIGGFDANGKPFARTSVTLLGADETPPHGMYASWMPYQVSAAAKDAIATQANQINAVFTAKFALGDHVGIDGSNEVGIVEGRAEYLSANAPKYFVRYRNALGCMKTEWWDEHTLRPAHDVPATA